MQCYSHILLLPHRPSIEVGAKVRGGDGDGRDGRSRPEVGRLHGCHHPFDTTRGEKPSLDHERVEPGNLRNQEAVRLKWHIR